MLKGLRKGPVTKAAWISYFGDVKIFLASSLPWFLSHLWGDSFSSFLQRRRHRRHHFDHFYWIHFSDFWQKMELWRPFGWLKPEKEWTPFPGMREMAKNKLLVKLVKNEFLGFFVIFETPKRFIERKWLFWPLLRNHDYVTVLSVRWFIRLACWWGSVYLLKQ